MLFLYKIGLVIQLIADFKTPLRDKRFIWQIRNNTMVNYKRLVNVITTAEKVISEKLEGNFVECGVWKGGCSALLASKAKGDKVFNRTTFLFDSFQGLPEPTKEDGHGASIFSAGKTTGKLTSIEKNVGTLSDVKQLFNKLKLSNYKIIQGWFQDTLPKHKDGIGAISILRLDGDWYESTKVCLEELYDNVVENGFILIDDYNFWSGCKKAADEFFEARGISQLIERVDSSGIIIKKTRT